MPKIHLRPQFVSNPPYPAEKAKIDYFDTQVSGFMLEVRKSGKSTYYFRYRDKSGKIKFIRIGTPESIGVEEARNKAKALKSQTVIGFDPREQQERLKAIPTFREFIYNQYLPHIKTYKRSWKQDQRRIEQRLLKLWGSTKLNEIKTGDIVGFQNKLAQSGLKPSSVNRYMALVKYIFNLAERWDIIESTPIKNIKQLEDNSPKERYLTDQELYNLLEALHTTRSQVVPDIVEFLLLTGARRGEALGMTWAEIDMERCIWVLPPERNKANREKVIPLSQRALNVLQRRYDNGSGYVFPNPETGKPLKHFYSTWNRIRKAAGLPDVRLHDLRHSYASFLVNNGRSLYEVQKLLGHSQLSTTQRYAHLTEDTLKDATEIVGSLVGKW